MLHSQTGTNFLTFRTLAYFLNRLTVRQKQQKLETLQSLNVSPSVKGFSPGRATRSSQLRARSSCLSRLQDFWEGECTGPRNCNRYSLDSGFSWNFAKQIASQEFDPIWFLPPTSYLRQWFEASDTFFPSDGERFVYCLGPRGPLVQPLIPDRSFAHRKLFFSSLYFHLLHQFLFLPSPNPAISG